MRSRSIGVTPSSAAATAVMRGNRGRDTKPELGVRTALHRLGLRFRKNFLISTGTSWVRVDVAFTRQRIAVFIDGCFWHRCPIHATSPHTNSTYWTVKLQENVERDQRHAAELATAGWRVLRVWEHTVPEEAAQKILAALHEHSRPDPHPGSACRHAAQRRR